MAVYCSGANLQNLALVFGQVTSRGGLTRCFTAGSTHYPVDYHLQEVRHFYGRGRGRINGGKASAEFTAAMAEYAQSLDISKSSFQTG